MSFSIELVLLAARRERQLSVLLRRHSAAGGRDRWRLPWDAPGAGEPLEQAARRLARDLLGAPPAWLEQLGAFPASMPDEASELTVVFLALVPESAARGAREGEWFLVGDLPQMYARQREILEKATGALRDRMDVAPVAFRLLPSAFTLSELQAVYELLLGRRLHKASFRRALQASWLVEPTDEWRSEGKGRPAQLYRYAPRKRRSTRRAVRFDLLF